MMTPVGRLALVRAFPRSEMISVMNFVLIPALIGPLLGPFAGGLIVHWFHWRADLLHQPAARPVRLLARAPDDARLPRRRDHAARLARILLFGSGILLLSYVLEVLGDHSLPYVTALQLGIAAAVLLGLYVAHARADSGADSRPRDLAHAHVPHLGAAAASSRASASAACRSCCRCCTRSASATRPGRPGC